MLDRRLVAGSMCVIHFVDVARMDDELRPVCGAWGDEVTWTTILAVMTCPECALALREKRPGGSRTAASPRTPSSSASPGVRERAIPTSPRSTPPRS